MVTLVQRLDRLISLFHRRWSVPTIAALARAEGDRFVPLVHKLGASPAAVRQTLDDLIDRGWVAPNPGYGHPLRPEYILTGRGQKLAPACLRLDSALSALDLRPVALRKWSMPVLYVVGDAPARFSDIAGRLDGITDRALSLTLRDLGSASVLARQVLDGRPPRSLYAATTMGQELVPILAEI
jgi:DNA-binding HxlR family transcriptional regulator